MTMQNLSGIARTMSSDNQQAKPGSQFVTSRPEIEVINAKEFRSIHTEWKILVSYVVE